MISTISMMANVSIARSRARAALAVIGKQSYDSVRSSLSPRAAQPAQQVPPDEPVGWLQSPQRLVLGLIVASFVGRLLLAHYTGLGIDESYEASVARPLSLSYFDHPPLSFWIVGITAALTGGANAALLRLPFLLLFAGTTWMMYRLGARLFSERAGAIAAVILNVTPVLSVSAGGWVLPDGPLIFWMLASALCLE
ncbi:MAG: glycosyltransferase family 39 protein, partial [Gemmatimonadaceae bacterium]|nr:glycosyltransferase family 39 protein [Gemmatimonadaceae bacterium]